MLLQGWALLAENINGCILPLHGCLQLVDQSFFDVVQLVQLVLVHRLLLQVIITQVLVSPLNRLIVHVAVILALVLLLFPDRVHRCCV